MALRVPLERAKPGRERKRPCVLSLPALHCLASSFRSIGHALFPSLLLYTPNKHSSAHVRERHQNSVPPAVTRPSACQCIWAELVGIKAGDQCCQTSKAPSRLNSGSRHCERRLDVYSPGRLSVNASEAGYE